MRNLRKKFKNPKSPWDVQRITEEKKLVATYGLRRKKEIRNAEALLRGFRRRARELIAVAYKEKETELLQKLQNMGILTGKTLDDILALTVEDILNRRLQTIVFNKEKAMSVKHARQIIVHEQVMIGDRKIKYPSYLVNTEEEGAITVTKEYEKKEVDRGQTTKVEKTADTPTEPAPAEKAEDPEPKEPAPAEPNVEEPIQAKE